MGKKNLTAVSIEPKLCKPFIMVISKIVPAVEVLKGASKRIAFFQSDFFSRSVFLIFLALILLWLEISLP